jgi:hypothetical protein
MEQVSVIAIDLAKNVFQLEAEAVQALVRVRLLQIKQIVQTGNQLRGILVRDRDAEGTPAAARGDRPSG